MRVRATQKADMQQSGNADVVDKPAIAGEQRLVFQPPEDASRSAVPQRLN